MGNSKGANSPSMSPPQNMAAQKRFILLGMSRTRSLRFGMNREADRGGRRSFSAAKNSLRMPAGIGCNTASGSGDSERIVGKPEVGLPVTRNVMQLRVSVQ